MPDAGAILTAFREELIAAGLVRRPSDAGALPPAHIEPLEGAVAPGDRHGTENDDELVISLFHSGDLSETNYDAALRRRTVIDVRYRTPSNAGERRIMALDAAIRARLISPATNYGYGFIIGTAAPLNVYQAALWGGLGPVQRGAGIGLDLLAKYLIECAP